MPKKVLIIEDETALLYALQSQLSAEGFQTISADDGQKAMDIIEHIRPDVIILDIILPKIDGWQLLKNIKQKDETKDIPVIIVSNLSDEVSRKKGIQLGAKDYLAKINYSVEELIAKIKDLIK